MGSIAIAVIHLALTNIFTNYLKFPCQTANDGCITLHNDIHSVIITVDTVGGILTFATAMKLLGYTST